MVILRKITIVLSALSILICCVFFNLMGSIEFLNQGYENCGYALIISTAFLLLSFVFGLFKKTWTVLLFNIVGTASYIYTLAVLKAIPNDIVPAQSVEKIMMHHIYTVSVTIFLALLAVFNYLLPERIKERDSRKNSKKMADERSLTDDERIV